MKPSSALRWTLVCLFAAGCAQQAPKPQPPAPRPPQATPTPAVPAVQTPATTILAPAPSMSAPENVLVSIQNFSGMSQENQKKELANLTKNIRKDTARLQLAMIYCQPGSRYKDLARSIQLVDEYLKPGESRDAGMRALAQWIRTQAMEQQKLEDSTIALQQKAREEQGRAESLQRKLDELLSIEKTLRDRKPSP